MESQLVRLKDAPAHGIPYLPSALNWIAFWREQNGAGAAGAVVKVGGRLFIDPARFSDWMRSNPRISPPGVRQGQTKRSKAQAA